MEDQGQATVLQKHRVKEKRRQRLLLWSIVGLVFAAAVWGAWAIGNTWSAATGSDDSDLYDVNNPVLIQDRVPGVVGPAAYLDQDEITTATYSCLRAHDEDLVLDFNTTWQTFDDGVISGFLPGSTGQVIIQEQKEDSEGCSDPESFVEFNTQLPESIYPGSWQFTSVITLTDVDGNELDAEVTLSERVSLVEREDGR